MASYQEIPEVTTNYSTIDQSKLYPIIFKHRRLTFQELWDNEPVGDFKVDIVRKRAQINVENKSEAKLFSTLQHNLETPERDLFVVFGQTLRNEIRRAFQKDDCKTTYHWPVSENIYESFMVKHKDFAISKNFKPLDKDLFDAYRKANRLVLSTVSLPQAEPLAWHAFVISLNFVRYVAGLTIATSNQAQPLNALVARANKGLFWSDLLYFKAMGFKTFDWGGIFTGQSLSATQENINNFKQRFGGKSIVLYDLQSAHSLKGHLYLIARKFLGKR
jgi:hypothetical protein